MKNTCIYSSCVGYKSINVNISNEAFSKGMMGIVLSETRSVKILGLEKVYQQKKTNHFEKNLIVMTKFPDNSLTLVKWTKFPDIFSKFPENSLTWRKFCFLATLSIFGAFSHVSKVVSISLYA